MMSFHGARRCPTIALALLALLAGPGCDAPNAGSAPAARATAAPRIIGLSAPATRFVVALGAGDQLVAVDEASARFWELDGVPVVELPAAYAMAADLILVPDLRTVELDPAHRSTADIARLVEFAPHDLEDAAALTRGLGAQLAGVAAATELERAFSRPIALVAEQADSADRPRVVGVVGVVELEPLTIAGGHSFETDLIEAGGGSSVTHGGEDTRLTITPDRWDELAPDLVIVATREVASRAERQRARSLIPARYPIGFFHFDRDTFWLQTPEAERMRDLISSAKRVDRVESDADSRRPDPKPKPADPIRQSD